MEDISSCPFFTKKAKSQVISNPTRCSHEKENHRTHHRLPHGKLHFNEPSKLLTWRLTWLSKLFTFRKIHAEEKTSEVSPAKHIHDTGADNPGTQGNGSDPKEHDQGQALIPSAELESLARAYIQKETGMDRVRLMFQKDHKGDTSLEVDYIKLALIQTLIITFFVKYVPAWNMARREFIRQNQATVFRTRIEAVRRMQDHISYTAAIQGGTFSAKVTAFSASFLVLSQVIASYRNKTSPLEYAVAAGITGGLARIHLGMRGVIVGSALGGTLGTLLGGCTLLIMKGYGITQEQRHLDAIMSKLEVEKSIIGVPAFQKKVEELRAENNVAS